LLLKHWRQRSFKRPFDKLYACLSAHTISCKVCLIRRLQHHIVIRKKCNANTFGFIFVASILNSLFILKCKKSLTKSNSSEDCRKPKECHKASFFSSICSSVNISSTPLKYCANVTITVKTRTKKLEKIYISYKFCFWLAMDTSHDGCC